MNDQLFVNAYIKILNDTLTEAVNKNLVLQAQLEVAKHTGAKAGEYEAKVRELEGKIQELSSVSSNNNALQNQINSLKAQLEQTNAQVNNKNSHVETFKRELVDARNIIKSKDTEIESLKLAADKVAENTNAQHQQKVDSLNAEINLLKSEIEELKSRKRKKERALNSTLDGNLISISDTF